ncbi:hypothetical protein SDC9_177563 [bioreactor metagenome]|uniref:Uncharacterized protein n=1 Tax=bioreactor metagenome TaxID=1076179 RepID=A0A645GV24_9ZZZZ
MTGGIIVHLSDGAIRPDDLCGLTGQIILDRRLAICPIGYVGEPIKTVELIFHCLATRIDQVGDVAIGIPLVLDQVRCRIAIAGNAIVTVERPYIGFAAFN